MRIFLSGPCSGYPEMNYPAFRAEAARLRALGYEVVNPAEICAPHLDWDACMDVCLEALAACSAVAMLPGWTDSRGASIEVARAQALRMPCRPAAEWIGAAAGRLAGRAAA